VRNCSGQSSWKNQSLSTGGQLKRNLGWTSDGSGSGSCLMENSRFSGVDTEFYASAVFSVSRWTI